MPAPAEPVEDPSKAKIDALQNSLDAALGELANAGQPKPTDPAVPADPAAPDPAAPADPAKPADPPAEPAKPADPTKPTDSPKGDEAWKSEIDGIKKSQEDFQNTTAKELEGMKLKDEMIGLTSEIQAAIIRFPDVDPDAILLEIESGSDKTVTQIAEAKQETHKKLVDKIATEQGEKIKADIEKENDGKIKVPQSAGTSPTPPGTPDPTVPTYSKAAHDSAWANATKEAKANLQ